MLIYILVGLAVFVATLLVAALFLPSKYHIEKKIVISKPLPEVYERIADLNHYAKWNPWQSADPTAKGTITGEPKTPGHRYAWEGKKTGIGHLTLRDLDMKHIHFDLEFITPFQSKAGDDWMFEEWGNGECKVTWSNNGSLSYPVARLIGPFMNGMMNKQFEKGLVSLKNMCEKG